jgi:kynurenine formamidase
VRVLDLAKTIKSGMQAHVTTSIVPLMRHGDAAGKFDPPCEGFASNLLVMSDHCGTHMDAPFHFIREGLTIEHVSPARLIGPAVVCDLSFAKGPFIEKEDLRRSLEAMTRTPRKNGVALLKTVDSSGRGKGLTRGAAELLVDLRVKLVGTDHGGIDDTQNRDRPAHMVLLGQGVIVVESLVGLDRIEGEEVLFMAFPLALEGGTGSPVRPIVIDPIPPGDWYEIEE